MIRRESEVREVARDGKTEQHAGPVGVFCIPGGLFLGIGFGLLYHNSAAGTLIGLGAGFIGWAILDTLKR